MHFNRKWSDPNGRFSEADLFAGGLDAALAELELHHRESGFIKDDLADVERHVFEHPVDPTMRFRVQYNPKRAKRFEGAGVRTPPPGVDIVNDGCFLCRENIPWQQQNAQVGLEVRLTDDVYHALMNPFPLMPNHLVVAEEDHITQEWEMSDGSHEKPSLSRLLDDLCETAARLPYHVGFYNGIDAGASISTHLHFQFFRRLSSDSIFPLEQRNFSTPLEDGEPELVVDYPVEVARWRGSPTEVTDNATSWIRRWVERNASRRERLSSNFIAASLPLESDISLYFFPRDRTKSRCNGLSGLVGGLELLGELVFSSEDEKALLDRGEVDYFFVERALGGIRTPFFEG